MFNIKSSYFDGPPENEKDTYPTHEDCPCDMYCLSPNNCPNKK